MLNDFFNLIFPKICAACERPLLGFESTLCTLCIYQLPKTNSHQFSQNIVEQLFWGRVNLNRALAYYYFEKEGRVQHMIHNLKYRGQTQIGVKVGQLYGYELKRNRTLSAIDAIIPVPLTAQKLKQRGFNQSLFFAQGLSDTLEIPVLESALLRVDQSSSQTNKSRFERWKNVATNFSLKEKQSIVNKNVLLVDDVITTGSTIESCAQPLIEAGCDVSAVAMAIAKK